MITILHQIFPNRGVVFFALGWIAVSMLASTLFNNQDIHNKRLNMLKSFLYTCFMISWALVAGYSASGRFSLAFPVFGAIVWVFYLIGDWTAYLMHQLRFSPGGLQGFIWFGLANNAKRFQARAATRALTSLRPTERKLYEAEMAEKRAALVKQLVDNVPDAKVIAIPPPLATVLPGVDKVALTPAILVSVLPESPILVTPPDPKALSPT